MKIELKNIKLSLTFSEETICFKADIHVNGKKAGYCENDGHGGCTYYNGYDLKGKELIAKADQWLSEQPSILHDIGSTRIEIKSNLENLIDVMVNDYINAKEAEKFEKKLKKDMLKYIVFKSPNGYMINGWKNLTIDNMLSEPKLRIMLKMKVDELLKRGEKILNTNLPADILNPSTN